MKVKSLLAKARKCKTQADAAGLLESLKAAFADTHLFSGLSWDNAEGDLEAGDGEPFVRFELNHVISDHYITMIRPALRTGELTIDVVTQHVLDGAGMGSHSWKPVQDLDVSTTADEDDTVQALAQSAKASAIDQHVNLLIRAGVPNRDARLIANKQWPVAKKPARKTDRR